MGFWRGFTLFVVPDWFPWDGTLQTPLPALVINCADLLYPVRSVNE